MMAAAWTRAAAARARAARAAAAACECEPAGAVAADSGCAPHRLQIGLLEGSIGTSPDNRCSRKT